MEKFLKKEVLMEKKVIQQKITINNIENFLANSLVEKQQKNNNNFNNQTTKEVLKENNNDINIEAIKYCDIFFVNEIKKCITEEIKNYSKIKFKEMVDEKFPSHLAEIFSTLRKDLFGCYWDELLCHYNSILFRKNEELKIEISQKLKKFTDQFNIDKISQSYNYYLFIKKFEEKEKEKDDTITELKKGTN